MFSKTVKNLWNYREFITSNVVREFQLKYQNSLLGATWSVINPLSMILVYTLIFTNIMKAKLPGIEGHFGYSIYICSGIIFWGFFSELVSKGANVYLDNASLLKKLKFPRECLPVTVLLTALVNFSIIFSLFAMFLLITGNFPFSSVIQIIPIIVLLSIFGLSLGFTLGVVNVFFRDVGQLLGVVLQFWFWATPIIYPLDILPAPIQSLIQLNPMTIIVGSLQKIFVMNESVNFSELLWVSILSLILFIFSLYVYKKNANEIADEI
ncbi:O-antigen export system permease protein RfbD [Grimontia indica]|uniref:Transport permease protein n=1 Tax=Grimontia indica TaxID=1056512 RepID=R1IHB9_9GAMM|nr:MULTISPECIES: ABC transporter permease [Grimontia]EOD80121.1 O-antigen export system permease protein RfbD [Grimontia indica]